MLLVQVDFVWYSMLGEASVLVTKSEEDGEICSLKDPAVND